MMQLSRSIIPLAARLNVCASTLLKQGMPLTKATRRPFSALPDRHGTTILCVRKDGIGELVVVVEIIV